MATTSDADLRAVQRRRELPTRVTQRLQLALQRTMIDSMRAGRGRVPVPMRLAAAVPPVRRLVSRFLALGVRNETVRTGVAERVRRRATLPLGAPDE